MKEGTEAFKAWQATPLPVYSKIYFFSILNPEDVVLNHAKPILVEKGPYVFRLVCFLVPPQDFHIDTLGDVQNKAMCSYFCDFSGLLLLYVT